MHKLIIHPGLPKTATTTLQFELFPAIVGSEWDYAGILQPRDTRDQNELFRAMYRAVVSGENIQSANSTLKSRLAERPILISEEIFTASTVESTWREKLDRLRQVTQGTDLSLLFTVREPRAAIFSNYVETIRNVYVGGNDPFSIETANEDRMAIYRYRTFFGVVEQLFDCEIEVCDWKDVLQGKCRLLEQHFPLWEGFDFHDLSAVRRNSKRATDKAVTISGNYTARDAMRRLLASGSTKRPDWTRSRLVQALAKGLDRISFGRKDVPRPSDDLARQMDELLADDIAFVRDRYGVTPT